jgi:RNA-binding protein
MLTSKQRSYLRSLSNKIPAIFQIGRNGIEDNIVKQFNEALEARELVKAHVLRNSSLSAREAADKLALCTGAEVVAVVGNKFVLYKESKNNKTIFL